MESESSQPCKRRCTEKDKIPYDLDTEGNVSQDLNGGDDGEDDEGDGGDDNQTEGQPENDLAGNANENAVVDHTLERNSPMNGVDEAQGINIHGDIQEVDENSRSSSCSSGGDLCSSATDILVDWVNAQNISTISVPSCPHENRDSDSDNRPSCSNSSESCLHREPPHIVVEDTGEIIPVENLNSDSSDNESSDALAEPTCNQQPSSGKSGSTFRVQPNRHTEMTLTFGGTGSRSNMTHTVLLGDGCKRRESVQYVFNFRSMSDSATQTDPLKHEMVVDTGKVENVMPCSDSTCSNMVLGESVNSEFPQHINNLPSNILIQIFKSLSMYELLCQASLVCKMWHTLCRDPDLWRTVDLSHQHKAQDNVLSQLTSFSDRVTSINLEDTKLLTTYGISLVCVKCKHLQKLKLTR